MNTITKRCCFCSKPHIMGPDYGAPYSDGMCWWAYYKGAIKFFFQDEIPHFIETWTLPLTVGYVVVQIIRWANVGFKIIGGK